MKTPFRIILTKNSCKKLLGSYREDVEKGGILLCSPIFRDDKKYLIIQDVIFIRNISPRPEISYQEDPEEYRRTLSLCFNETADVGLCIPMEFHTHPKIEPDSQQEYLFTILTNPGTSEADQELSNPVIKISDQAFSIPNVLVTRPLFSNDTLFFGMYGGLIAPTDFMEYMVGLTGKTWKEIFETLWKWADDVLWKKLLLVAIAAGITVLSVKYYKIAIPVAVTLFLSRETAVSFQSSVDIPKYFVEIKGENEVIVEIPKYDYSKDPKAPLELKKKLWELL